MTDSLLTSKQRDFLEASDEELRDEYSKQDRHYYRKQIRQRVGQGLADISTLLEHWPAEERADVFADRGFSELWTSSHTAEPQPSPSTERGQGLADLVTFAWLAGRDMGYAPEDIIRQGVRMAVGRENPGYHIEVTLSVELERREADAELARLKLLEGDDLTDAEREALLEDDEVREALAEYLDRE